MSKLCDICVHQRVPEPPVESIATVGAGSASMQAALNRKRNEKQRRERAEGALYRSQGRGVVLLESPPTLYEWCAAKSVLNEGRYFFCDWWEDDNSCPKFKSQEVVIDVMDNQDGLRAGAEPSNHLPLKPLAVFAKPSSQTKSALDDQDQLVADVEPSDHVPLKPLAVFARPGAQTKSAPTLVPEPRIHEDEWELPLGTAYKLRPRSRNIEDDALGPGSFHIDYEPAPLDERPAIRGNGLAQTYLIFGGPGAGKTYYFKYLLSSLLAHERKPGCLLLDPKGALTGWLEDELKKLNRLNDLTVLRANAKETAFNVFGKDLPPKELGRLLSEVVLAGAPGIDEGWAVLVGDLLESAAVVIANDKKVKLTAARLLNDILYTKPVLNKDGKPVIDKNGKPMTDYTINIRARRLAGQGDTNVDARIAADRIGEYFSDALEPRQRRFVRQVIERSLAELALPEWAYLSSTETNDTLYSDIIENHRVVSVAVGQSSPAFQRSMSTLIKSLFQQAALGHLSKRTQEQTSGQKPKETPFFILACDEYAQAITEGQTGLVSDSRFFSLSREAGCLSLLALQSVATGRSRFSADMHDRWEGILGNVTVKFFMKLNDSETAQMASDLAGNQHSFVQVMSQQQSAQGLSDTNSLTMLEHPRVPPWYLTNRMRQGHAMVHGTLDGESMPTSLFVEVPR
jgi:hypothetical protein